MYNTTWKMERTSGLRMWTWTLAMASVLWVAGCTQEKPVITTADLQDDNGDWVACEDIDAFLGVARHGDDCYFGGGSGAGCGMSEYCTSRSGTCLDGKLSVSNVSIPGCQWEDAQTFSLPEPRPNTSWTDCATAMTDGQAGEPCTGGGWSCSQPAAEACCQELAMCDDIYSSGRLLIATVCATSCASHPVDDTRPTVTSCEEARTARPNDPCTGEISCIDYASQYLDFRWCDAGTLRVNDVLVVPQAVFDLVVG